MFTGIVEEMGTVSSMSKVDNLVLWDGSTGEGYVLVVECQVCIEGCYLGASIAVNGTCLTATEFTDKTISFGIAPETLRCTNLGSLGPGDRVNMERAAKMSDRNSGHYVQGHVDETGEIIEKWQEDDSLWVKVKVSQKLIPYVVHKGFIAIDGTSLTVCEVNSEELWFTFMLVQYTQQKIIIPNKPIGGRVNLEIDVLSKYVSKVMNTLTSRFDRFEQAVTSRLDKLETRLDNMQQK